MSAVNFILSLARKILARESKGITTIPNKMAVEQKAGEIAATLQDAGLPLNRADDFIKSEQDLVRILNMIESTPPVTREVPSGIRSTQTAKIMDMQGKEIPQGSKIMGGKAADEQDPLIGSLDEFHADFVKETGINIPKENLKQAYDVKKSYPSMTPIVDKNGKFIGGEATQKMYPESKKFKVQEPDELNAEIKARLDKGNKEGIARIKAKQKTLEDVIDNLSSGFSGDRKVDAELVAEELATRAGKVYDDLPTKERIKFYDEAYQALTKRKFDPPEDMAQGGRAGFDNGGAPSIKYDFDRKQGPMGPVFETNKVEDAIREIIKRNVPTDFARVPVTEGAGILLGLDEAGIAGLKDLLGGELKFGAGKNFGTGEKQFDLMFRKKFKDGSNMTRRTFLKILGGAMAIPIVGKFLKPFRTAKGVTKVPMIKTDNVPGKPEWFDQLVNKVIVEGDDVTKRFATGERQSIHQKTLDDGSVVRVTEDVDDGAVRVEYQSEKNVFGDDVQLEYKKPLPDEGNPRPKAEFTTAESGPVGRGGRSPDGDDYEIDVDEVGGTSIRDLDSDVSKLKEYATGKKPTMTEIVQNKKRRDKAKAITEDPEAQSDAVIRRQGEMLDVDPDPDFASGGIARMLGE